MYHHRQLSVQVASIAFLAAFVAIAIGMSVRSPLPFIVGIVAGALAYSMSRLETEVDEYGVTWAFVPLRVFRGTLALGEIASYEPTRVSWFDGIGYHYTFRHGWLWNVAPGSAVRFTKTNGSIVTIGTDDADGLCAAVARYTT